MIKAKWVGAHPNNFTPGRSGNTIKLIVVHSTQGSLQSAANWFNNPAAKVSAHYGIGKDGSLEQYVQFEDTAHHAGQWKVNQESIGIEFEDIFDGVEHNPVQYDIGARLISVLCKRFSLGKPSSANIRPHSDFRATKCPGDLDVSKLISLAQVAYEGANKEWKVKIYNAPAPAEKQPVVRFDNKHLIVHVDFKDSV